MFKARFYLFKEFLVKTAIVSAAVIVVIAILALLNDWRIDRDCRKFQEITGVETKHEFLTDCYVMHRGEFTSYFIYLARQVGK